MLRVQLTGCICRYSETRLEQQSNKTQPSAAVQEISQTLKVKLYSTRLTCTVLYRRVLAGSVLSSAPFLCLMI